ncbi:beta-L-arabinofuranosidase domain-containing protein [Cellulomonas sp. Y8]|uniref:beta-L-arabinofuranosidase domain-containing protein n=1 Tax=Cellulomonas sp. Y8 TaxID=2591145 RepID=UPI001FEE4FFC|nr:beta-L-arabinofuranosidase domain-containing protein [Cellulomonas sp. Y8]
MPSWAAGATVDGRPAEPGYVAVAGPAAGGSVVLDLPVAPRFTVADPRVDAVRGQVAVEAGPLVYALESVDLGADVGLARVDTGIAPEARDGAVTVHARTVDVPEGDWPYAGRPAEAGEDAPREVPLVPYHAWGQPRAVDDAGLDACRLTPSGPPRARPRAAYGLPRAPRRSAVAAPETVGRVAARAVALATAALARRARAHPARVAPARERRR